MSEYLTLNRHHCNLRSSDFEILALSTLSLLWFLSACSFICAAASSAPKGVITEKSQPGHFIWTLPVRGFKFGVDISSMLFAGQLNFFLNDFMGSKKPSS